MHFIGQAQHLAKAMCHRASFLWKDGREKFWWMESKGWGMDAWKAGEVGQVCEPGMEKGSVFSCCPLQLSFGPVPYVLSSEGSSHWVQPLKATILGGRQAKTWLCCVWGLVRATLGRTEGCSGARSEFKLPFNITGRSEKPKFRLF